MTKTTKKGPGVTCLRGGRGVWVSENHQVRCDDNVDMFVTPFVSLKGTLSDPHVALNKKGALLQGGLMAATGAPIGGAEGVLGKGLHRCRGPEDVGIAGVVRRGDGEDTWARSRRSAIRPSWPP